MAKHLYAVKGGCNLRFFFKSIRYSKDLDLDVHTTAKETLRKNVNQILKFQGLPKYSARTAWKSASFPSPNKPRQRSGGKFICAPTREVSCRRRSSFHDAALTKA